MSLCAVIGGGAALSSLECTESDGPPLNLTPVRSFSLVDSVTTVVETDTSLTVQVRRSCGCDSAGVWVSCSAGSATPDEDFIATTTRLAFGHGSALESLTVRILADTVSESTEVVLVTLGPASPSYEIADPKTAILRIVDDDSTLPIQQLVAFERAVWLVPESSDPIELTVRRAATGDSASVDLRTLGGSAAALHDYLPLAMTLHFAPGDSVLHPAIAILQDSLAERAETLRVVLENPSLGCGLGQPDTARVVILDDESPCPVFAFTQARYHAFEGQGEVRVSVSCAGCTGEMGLVMVSARAVDESARAGTEYVAQTTRLVFNALHTRVEFTVDLIDDSEIESDKAFTVELFDPIGEGLVAPPEAVAVEILDDDTPVEPPTLALPLRLGNQWTFAATTSWQSGFEDPRIGYGTSVASLEESIDFRGHEYLRLGLACPSGPTSGVMLIRQSGDSLLFVCPNDTLPAEPGSTRAELQETLPWLLVDLSTAADTTVTLFSGGGDCWTALDRRTLRVFGRENTVVPAGQFRQTVRVRYEQQFEYRGVAMGFSSSAVFTLADSVGFLRIDLANHTYGQSDPVWHSCDGELVSCSLVR